MGHSHTKSRFRNAVCSHGSNCNLITFFCWNCNPLLNLLPEICNQITVGRYFYQLCVVLSHAASIKCITEWGCNMTKVRKFNTFQKGLEDYFVNLMLGCLFLCVFLLLKGKRPLLCQTVTCQPKDTLKFCSVPEKKEEKNSPLLFFILFWVRVTTARRHSYTTWWKGFGPSNVKIWRVSQNGGVASAVFRKANKRRGQFPKQKNMMLAPIHAKVRNFSD